MTYYTATGYGLIARETVSIDGPEGARGRGGADTALANATASAAELTSEALPVGAPGIDELLTEARSGLRRLRPEAALAAITDGAPRWSTLAAGAADRRRGSPAYHYRLQRARMAPRSPREARFRPGPLTRIIVMCSEGYASTPAAASLRRIGLREATDLDGGFRAWAAAACDSARESLG
jgi:rhodanese-related sulfurtransferase